MPDRLGTFYGIWPVIDGKPLQLQWGEIRSNQAETKAIVRQSYQQLEPAVDELNALRSFLGQAYGDLDFSLRYRLMYVESTDEFCLQKNDGTVEIPSWTDVFCVRFHDGQFQVVSEGGILSTAGFYNFSRELHLVADSHSLGTDTDEDVSIFNTDRILFDRDSGLKVRLIDCGEHSGSPEVTFTAPFGRSQIFEASGEEWVINHNFGAGPQMVQVMDADDRVIIPDTVDVSDPNTAYFYFHSTVVGSVIIATGGLGAAELRPKDPFYLVVRTDTQSSDTRRLRPNANLIFDHKYFYVETHEDIVDGCPGANPRAFVTILPEIFYLNDLKDVTILERPHQGQRLGYSESLGAWTAMSGGAGGAFYLHDLLDVDVPGPDSGDSLVYNEVTGQWEAQPQVRSSFIFTQATPVVEWIIGHGQNSELLIGQAFDTEDRLIFPDVIDYSNPNIAYFYFVEPQAGKAFLIATGATASLGDHDALTGLLDDDHPQYIRVDGTRAFTGNQSHGGNRITGLGAPVASSDAARLQDVAITVAQSNDLPSFSGITTIKFEASNFYVTQNSVSPDEVQINFRGFTPESTNSSYLHSQPGAAVEWIVNHSLDSTVVITQVYDTSDVMIVPDVVDASNPNVTYFYFSELTSGRALIIGEDALAAAGITTHNQLNGLSSDDHTQYIRVDGTRAFTGDQSMGGNQLTNLGAPMAASDAARLQDIGPGFYGIIVKDGTHLFKDDTISFNGNEFYLTKDSAGNPEVNLKTAADSITLQDAYNNGDGIIEATTLKPLIITGVGDVTHINSPDTSAGDLVFTENFGPKWVVGKNNGGNFRIKGPSGGSIFEIEPGSPADSLIINVDGVVSVGGTLDVGDSLKVENAVTAEAFYLASGYDLTRDFIDFDIPIVDVENYWIQNFAPQAYIIDDVVIITKTGSCVASFYIHGDGQRHPGVSVTGLDPIAVTSTKATALATANRTVNVNDSVVLSVPSNTSATHLRGRVGVSLLR